MLIVSPVMKRAHNLFWSSTIAFIDTSASCDSTSSNVTIMLTATKAGAVPLVVLLHEAQTAESYQVALELAQDNFPIMFGGNKVSSMANAR